MTMEEAALAEMIAAIADGSIPRCCNTTASALHRRYWRCSRHRSLRQGMPEVIYGPRKSPEQCVAIVQEMLKYNDGPVLITRVSDAQEASLSSIEMADATGYDRWMIFSTTRPGSAPTTGSSHHRRYI